MEERQRGSELRYKAVDEVANSHPASSYTLWYLDLDFISINDNFNAAKIFLMIFFSQSLWCHSRGRIWFHALKSWTVKFKIKTVRFLSYLNMELWHSEKKFIWNAHWCTSEALKIILIAWARCWLGGLKENQQTPSSRAQSPIFTRPPEPHTESPTKVPTTCMSSSFYCTTTGIATYSYLLL